MNNYFIESFKIEKLWGYQDINLPFHKDVNVLIGPNGSGKTTVLNLLHSILSADLRSVINVNFEEIKIKLKSFKGRSIRTLTINLDTENRVLKIRIGRSSFNFDIDPIAARSSTRYYRNPETGEIVKGAPPWHYAQRRRVSREELDHVLTRLVPIVWLPISRHSPTVGGEEERYTRTDSSELVDSRLPQLVKDDLPRYHADLNAQLSERYRKFEHQVLSGILYNKEDDQFRLIRNSTLHSFPTEVEKEQLMGAFKAAGLLDEQMQNKINDHFAAAERIVKRIRKNIDKNTGLDLEDVLVLPLIRRTQAMVEYARELEKDRENIFAPLRLYEKTASSFFDGKSIEVDGNGQLKIELSSLSPPSELDSHLLSSGEKQILILLTEALLTVNEPVVYIADEPELSLHVTWQEKLLESLVTLGGQKQIIVATHSPDIVGKFRDNVITLGKEN